MTSASGDCAGDSGGWRGGLGFTLQPDFADTNFNAARIICTERQRIGKKIEAAISQAPKTG